MYNVSSAFLTALRQPSMVSSTLVQTSDGTTLSIRDGAVTMDARRGITRTCELELIADSSRSALDVYNLVMQPGVELTVYRGLLVNGSYEYVPLGVFSTDSAEVSRSVTGSVKWSGSDRSKKISRAKFVDPYQITAGTDVATAVTNLLRSRWASTPCNFSNVSLTMTASLVFEAGDSSDPWQSARDLLLDHGYDLNFDGNGTARAVAVPDPAQTAPTFDFGAGSTNLVLGADLRGSLEQTYNGVIASGEGTDVATPVRAEVWDTDQTSPTYYLSGFGKVPLFYSSPLLTTVAMCQAAGQTLLSKLKGRSEQLSWPAVVNPALEPLDVITMTIAGTTSTCVIDALTVPLKASDAMTAVARATSV